MAEPDMSLALRRTLKTRAALTIPQMAPDAATAPASLAELDRRAGSHLCRIERKLDRVLQESLTRRPSRTLHTLLTTSLGMGLGMLLMTAFHL